MGSYCILLCAIGTADPTHNWTVTRSETIWRARYTNCDKGYYVELPPSVVAHATPPPSPHHGFLISAANAQRIDRVTFDLGRIVSVEDEYNSMLISNPRAYLDWELNSASKAHLTSVHSLRFHDLPGVEASFRSVVNHRLQFVHELIVFRKPDDLIYINRLYTDLGNQSRDRALYEQVRNGFHLFPINSGECVNE